jgi:hypothetical protein
MKREFELSTRREFFGSSARTLAVLTAIATQRLEASARDVSEPYVYDLSRYQKTDPKLISHEEVARWKSPRPEPRRLGLGPDDTLYLCAGNYVTALTPAGQRGLEIALPGPAACVTVAKNGEIYVGLRDHVEIFDAKGQRQAAWDSPGKKAWLTGIAVTDKDVFVADSGGRVLLRYDKSGSLVRRIGERNKERNIPGFIVPSPFLDVEIAGDGLLRVNNPGRHRVETYTFDGDFEGAWGRPTAAIEGFCGCCNPINLALLPDGRLVTCEKGLPRVKIYSASGEFQSVVAGVEAFPENGKTCGPSDCTSGGLDAVVDSQGRICILDFVTGEIHVMKAKA